ncbi:MAG: hypothetical protein M1834_000556 [Cirrosporium novae-zelandiae]|nr:MAG: hypothetical protein M1834_000556 [Cirrosporium novae-zelandiae]
MSAGFGFSVGDFIAALELAATVIDAFRESGNVSRRHYGLLQQIESLKRALDQVERLGSKDSQRDKYIAINNAVSRCQNTIDDFLKKMQKYEPHHHPRRLRKTRDRAIGNSRESLRTSNVQILQVVLDIQTSIMHIPRQIERQQPVYMIDALRKPSPFYLEFVRSAEALIAVLRVNFKKFGAAEKIDRGEFVIQDTCSKREIDLSQDWEMCFLPGQRVDMSMVFNSTTGADNTCPNCREISNGAADKEVECKRCRMTFRRIQDLDEKQQPFSIQSPEHGKGLPKTPLFSPDLPPNFQELKRIKEESPEDLRKFRRVKIIHRQVKFRPLRK